MQIRQAFGTRIVARYEKSDAPLREEPRRNPPYTHIVKFAVVIGSATPPGRTHAVAAALGAALEVHRGDAEVTTIDLASLAFQACDGRPLEAYDDGIRRAVTAVTEARGVLFVTPVYRATYTGVLKNFLDILPLEALRDTAVGTAVIGGSQHHYLGADLGLRAVFAWFGALAAPTSAYFTGSDFDERKQPAQKALGELAALARTIVTLASNPLAGSLGPPPLAGRT